MLMPGARGRSNWVILASFRARVVHRKVGETLPAILGRPIRAKTVSGRRDAQCCRGAFHSRVALDWMP
jgi:hypothetical protein